MNGSYVPLFANPLMRVELDLDLEKLSEFAFQLQDKKKEGVQETNIGGWQSGDIIEEKHEEFIKLKKEISKNLQIYHSQVFKGMVFEDDIIQNLNNMWVNINKKHHYNEWHIHPLATLSGTFYIKHDGSTENGNITFKNPNGLYIGVSHWPKRLVKNYDEITAGKISITPKSNGLLIFPSWLEHRAETNLKNNTRISLAFNTIPILEKKS